MNAFLLPLVSVLALAAGDDAVTARARADVESELEKVKARIPAPRLALSVKPYAGRGYALEQASFTLDNQNLPAPASLVGSRGVEKIFAGEIAPGPHELVVRMQYAGDFGLLSYMTGYKFKLMQKVEFEAPRGLEVQFLIVPSLDDSKEWKQRLGLKVERSQEMLAQVDATEPEPLQRPKIAAAEPAPPEPAEPVDAGAVGAADGAAVAVAVADRPPHDKRAKALLAAAQPAGAAPPASAAAEPGPKAGQEDEAEPAETAAPDAGPAEPTRAAVVPVAVVPAAVAPAPEPAPASSNQNAYLFGAVGLLLVGAVAFALYRRRR